MLDGVKIEMEFVWVLFGTAELATVIRQHGLIGRSKGAATAMNDRFRDPQAAEAGAHNGRYRQGTSLVVWSGKLKFAAMRAPMTVICRAGFRGFQPRPR
ncbi:hypothetical protein JMM63_20570 [Rhodovulum sulfidophilum]|nr:hypothetical protein [Rhodovulum sulfidophilum]MBL3597915.1 hypothetical protein [Rhodovulum sulfidophilum]